MLKIGESTKLTRDTEVVQIPDGFKVRLARGTTVKLTQALGDTYTFMTEYYTLVRLDGKDADAAGLPVPQASVASSNALSETLTPDEVKDRVWTQLRSVYDPEIPVNVVELGLVYTCEVQPVEGGYHVRVDMSLTAPGCGMGNVLKEDAERRILALPGVKSAAVQIVFDPPWNRGMMTEAARLELGL